MEEKSSAPYASFWQRLSAFMIDAAVMFPFMLAALYFERQSKIMFFVFSSFLFILTMGYEVYFNARWGQTIGKMACKIKLVSVSFQPIGYREALLRSGVGIILGIILRFFLFSGVASLGEFNYREVPLWPLHGFLPNFEPVTMNWLTQIWIWSELVVMLTNDRRRALHDFIAGTIVIKK